MSHKIHSAFPKLLFLAALATAAGCASTPRIETADALAQALKKGGVAYDSTERLNLADLPVAKIDEGLGLTGKNLEVLILRITDERTYKVATSVSFLMAIVKDLIKETVAEAAAAPGEVYLSKPFVIVIRAEPETGQVRAALKKLLREDPTKK